jgi:hypothetical protein
VGFDSTALLNDAENDEKISSIFRPLEAGVVLDINWLQLVPV